MAKYSKAASKKVEQSVKEMKKGTLKTGSGKKVTDKKQAVAIGLSEARSEGKKAPKKAAATTKKTTIKNSTAPVKKAAVKKSAAPVKKTAAKKSTTNSTKSAAPKKAAGKKVASPAKKAAPTKSTAPAKKAPPKKSSPAAKKTISKKSPTVAKPGVAKKAPVNQQGNKKPLTNLYNEPEVQDPTIQKNDVPVEEKNSDPAMLAFEEPNPIPRKKYAVAKDTYHNHLPPTAAKTSKKPSGKKPLWNSGN